MRNEVESAHEGVDISVLLSALKINDLVSPVKQGITKLIGTALEAAGMSAEAVGKVVLVGGGCRIPAVQTIVQKAFAGAEVFSSLHAEEVVVMGAAAQAAALDGCKVALSEAATFTVEVPVTPL
ncbi:MAG: Hsp70 family protein, partial [bacterium]